MSRKVVAGALAVAFVMGAGGCTHPTVESTGQTSPTRLIPRVARSPSAATTPGGQSIGPPHAAARRARWSLPTALSREVVVGDGDAAIIAGGLMPGDVSSSRAERIVLNRGAVTSMPALRQALHDSAGALVDRQVMVIGGGGAAELSAVERFGGNHRWQFAAGLPGPRSDLSVVPVPRGILVIGGYDGSTARRDVLLNSTTHGYQQFARLLTGVRYAAAVRVGGSVWIFGGESGGRELRTIQRIDLGTARVMAEGRLPVALGHAAAAAFGSRVLIMGGRTAPQAVTDKMRWFDTVSHRFSGAGRLPYPVADAGSVTYRDSVYLLGGETPNFTRRVVEVRVR